MNLNYFSKTIPFANHPPLVTALVRFRADHPKAKGLDERHILDARNCALQKSDSWPPNFKAKLTIFYTE